MLAFQTLPDPVQIPLGIRVPPGSGLRTWPSYLGTAPAAPWGHSSGSWAGTFAQAAPSLWRPFPDLIICSRPRPIQLSRCRLQTPSWVPLWVGSSCLWASPALSALPACNRIIVSTTCSLRSPVSSLGGGRHPHPVKGPAQELAELFLERSGEPLWPYLRLYAPYDELRCNDQLCHRILNAAAANP